MSKRDNNAQSLEAAHRFTRRAILAGGVCLGLGASTGAAMAGPALIGVVETLGLDAAAIDMACRASWRRRAILVPFGSWAALHDHASAPVGRLIEGAVLPAAATADGEAVPLPHPSLPVVLIGGDGPRGRIGVALRHPRSDAGLRELFAADVTLIELPPLALAPNVAAGLLEGAVLIGEGPIADARRRGLRIQSLEPRATRSLLPPLAITRLAGLGRRHAAA